ncbi:hypothetical protein SCATT_01580 [Streptantibioticus cattleyicolor NRRL 8057 = DSM 46488]|uniref:Uncharacterized protein n=1 Tax=Streptantibioticus cattleyicolor (strain ATCC 35852 / DSM 46488 / JCM 4925 / NBRC 14057 / NRRL 8057) TaxID=1003195 RepID=G8X1K0_STREN|nr:hypothetical protein SCATT_01580 [Streptantibioticus cattleyicolor NRRL 8057 = DSM 46488]
MVLLVVAGGWTEVVRPGVAVERVDLVGLQGVLVATHVSALTTSANGTGSPVRSLTL